MNKIDVLILHHVDPDGFCAGAIVRYHELKRNPQQNIECYGMNYGYDIPWGRIKRSKKIYVVDFSLPIADMNRVKEMVGFENLIWIDHHKTSIDDYEKAGLGNLHGLREIGKAGCELSWIYFNFDEPMPKGVRVIGRYDVWDIHYNNAEEGIFSEDIFPFIQSIKYHEARADNDAFWFPLFNDNECVVYPRLLDEGRLLYNYQQKMNARYAKSHSFEFEWEGLRFIALNALNCNSQIFDAVFDHNKHDAVLAYGYTNRNWSVSMYTTKKEIDVGALAHKYGGGGHANACGFHCLELPFEDKLEWKDAI